MEPSTPSRHSRPHSSHSSSLVDTDSWVSSFADLGSTSPQLNSSPATSYFEASTTAGSRSRSVNCFAPTSSPISLTPRYQKDGGIATAHQQLSPCASRSGSIASLAHSGMHISFTLPNGNAQLSHSRVASRRIVRTGSYSGFTAPATRAPSNDQYCKLPTDFEDSSGDEEGDQSPRRASPGPLPVSTQAFRTTQAQDTLREAPRARVSSGDSAASAAAFTLHQLAHTPSFLPHAWSNSSRASSGVGVPDNHARGLVSRSTSFVRGDGHAMQLQTPLRRASSGSTYTLEAGGSSSAVNDANPRCLPSGPSTHIISHPSPPPSSYRARKRSQGPPPPTGYDAASVAKRTRRNDDAQIHDDRTSKRLFGPRNSSPVLCELSSSKMAIAGTAREGAGITRFGRSSARRSMRIKAGRSGSEQDIPASSSSFNGAAKQDFQSVKADYIFASSADDSKPASSRQGRAKRREEGLPASFPKKSRLSASSSRSTAQSRTSRAPRPMQAAAGIASSSSIASMSTHHGTDNDVRRPTQFPGFYQQYRVVSTGAEEWTYVRLRHDGRGPSLDVEPLSLVTCQPTSHRKSTLAIMAAQHLLHTLAP